MRATLISLRLLVNSLAFVMLFTRKCVTVHIFISPASFEAALYCYFSLFVFIQRRRLSGGGDAYDYVESENLACVQTASTARIFEIGDAAGKAGKNKGAYYSTSVFEPRAAAGT